jgi:Tfp pilus assembly protein PilO
MNWQIVINVAVGVLMPLVIFALGYIVSLSKRITDLRVLVSDEFVKKPEITRIEQTMATISQTCTELLKAVAEIKGEIRGSGR